MKSLFKLFMALHVALYRLSGGKLGGTMRDFKVVLLTTTGRKSGKTFTTPLGGFEQPGGFVIIASNAGQPTHPAWYYNLKSQPQATLQVGNKILSVTAEVLSGEARTNAWQQALAIAPSYADYEQKTTREIPLILLRPEK
jgi:deazaflavin-dependent oxidoreductase (nitroreductase family)